MTQQRSTPSNEASKVTIAGVRFEHRRDALGIGTPRPRLSWTVVTVAAGWRQAAYEIEARGPDGQRSGTMASSPRTDQEHRWRPVHD